MENRRFFLICALGVVLFFIWQAWQEDHAPKPAAAQTVQAPPASLDDSAPVDDIPTLATRPEAPDEAPAETAPAGAAIQFETDVYRGEISLTGADLRTLELSHYAAEKQQPDVPVSLMVDQGDRLFIVQSGVLGQAGALASQYTPFMAGKTQYRLAPGEDSLAVSLEAQLEDGVRLVKTYRFRRGSYEIGLDQQIINETGSELSASPYVQMQRTIFKLGEEPPFVNTFDGYGVYEQKAGTSDYRFEKIKMEDIGKEPLDLQQTGGWLAMVQHYFVAAIIPPAGDTLRFIAKPGKTRGYLGQYIGAAQTVGPGAHATFQTRLYAGPILQQGVARSEAGGAEEGLFGSLIDGLENVAPGLDLTVDYGLLKPISVPLFLILETFHTLTGNWGFAIILLTLLVKLAMYKLSEAQFRSMAKMRKFAPRIQEIRDRYGDDRERQQKAMMDLYKKEGFNPLGGCWPMLVQFPVFIALYWVLLQSVELRQADFILWINDLSAKDPFYVLPVLFAGSMWLQQKLSGSTMTMDPMQQRIMSAMPIAMGAFFTMFPAGLVLYWFVSNLISIGQQWFINRKLDREGLGKR